MFRRSLAALLSPLLLLIPLAACAQPAAPTAAPVAANMPAVAATVAATAGATAATAAPATAPVAAPAPPMAAANAPRLGVDYEILPTQQPTYAQGKIEVAEVFSYACIHCAQFQPVLNPWLKKKPADIRYQYVPATFGGVWDNFARAYFAAEVLGVQAKTHDAVFKAVHVDHTAKNGSLEDIADVYGSLGVDRSKFLATMNSFGVTAQLNRAKQFALRTGVNATPTIIINGKYRVNVTRERGFEGMLATVDYLVAKERAALKPVAATGAAK